MKLNKKEFITEISKQLSYSEEKCIIINEILENNFFLNKKNKDKIVIELMEKLNISKKEANHIYNRSLSLIQNEIKNKLKHPFKNQNFNL